MESNQDTVLPKYNILKHPETGEEVLYPYIFEQKTLTSALSYQAQETDVFVASFAKSGTTWLQYIVWLILHHGKDHPDDRPMSQCIPQLDFDGKEGCEAVDDTEYPRMIKTHFIYDWTPHHPKAKYLYIARNPKDVVVSYYFHLLGFSKYYDCAGLQLNEVFKLFNKGRVECGRDYFRHVSEWYEKRNESNVLFLVYEDLKADIKTEVLKIAQFLGDKYKEDLLKDDCQLLSIILEKITVSSMKKGKDSKWVTASRPDNLPFIRKGIVGDHKNHLSADQITQLEKLIKERGSASGIDKLWD